MGPYEILAPLGAGGMSEVYRARDPRMGREVAIKIAAEQFSERFSREVHAVAALNHPNICHLYDVGPNYLVMELVEGATLADRIQQGPVPVDEALAIAKQIADALEAAHEKGIVHRDLKPANIKIKPDGTVKVLDFGLAKMADPPEASGTRPEQSPTLTIDAATRVGVILGTAAYMSPEQARGKPVDKRADIWAFGVVLYEMLTGEQLFQGETVTDVLAAVVTKDPDWKRVPARLRRLLRICLEKDPKQRLQAAGDYRLLLETAPETAAPRRPWLWRALTAALLIAAAGLGFIAYRHVREDPPRRIEFSVAPPEKGAFNLSQGVTLAVSPDGNRVAFIATVEGKDQIWLRDIGSGALRPIPGTDGAIGAPFWSPDSRYVGFSDNGKLKKVSLAGDPPVVLCDAPGGRSGSWSKKDIIVFQMNTSGVIFQVPAAGGTASPVTELDRSSGETSHRFPSFLPDDRHFLYTALTADEKAAVYIGDLDSKTRRKILSGLNAVYVPPGYLLFGRELTLMAQPFDLSKLALTGEAVPVADQVMGARTMGRLQFSASQNGALAYMKATAGGEDVQLTWFDRSGKALGTVGPAGRVGWAFISPDGTTVAFHRLDPTTGLADVWLHDLNRGTESRFTFNSQSNAFPTWSPDGKYLAFWVDRGGKGNVYKKSVGGEREEEPLETNIDARPDDWSHDGRYLILGTRPNNGKTGADIWVLPLAPTDVGNRGPFPYLHSDFNEMSAKLSPDDHWLAYVSNETKHNEVYVQTFPTPHGKWQISTDSGFYPVWSKDGKELFFMDRAQRLMAVEVRANGSNLEASTPKMLFETHFPPGESSFDVSKDGRFLIPTLLAEANPSMTVVVNWTTALKK